MRSTLSFALAAVISTAAIAEDTQKPKALPKFPPGSTVSDLLFPSYDENRRLQSTLDIKFFEVLKNDTFAAKGIKIVTYTADAKTLSRLDLKKATINRITNILSSDDPLKITDPSGKVDASGVRMDIQSQQLWLAGPGKIHVSPDSLKQRMATSRSPLKQRLASGVATTIAVAQLATAQDTVIPGDITPAEQAQIDKAVNNASSGIPKNTPSAKPSKEMKADAETIDKALKNFATQADINIQASGKAPEPIEKPKKEFRISASFEGGAYCDPENLALVFVNDVVLIDKLEKVTFKCKDKVKAFFLEKPSSKKSSSKKGAQKKSGSPLSRMGDLKSVIATGGVDITIANKDGTTTRLTGGTAQYDAVKERIVVKGNRPTLTNANGWGRAKSDKAYIVVHLKGGEKPSFIGPWRFEGSPPKK